MLFHITILLFIISLALFILHLEYDILAVMIVSAMLWLIASVSFMYVEFPVAAGVAAVNTHLLGYFFFIIGIVLLIVFVILPVMSLEVIKR